MSDWRLYPEQEALLHEDARDLMYGGVTFSFTMYTGLAIHKRMTYRGRFTRAEIRKQNGPAKKWRRLRGRFLRRAWKRGEATREWFG